MGRRTRGRAGYEPLPSQKCCRQTQLWRALEDEETLPHVRRQINQGSNALGAGMYNMIEGRPLPDVALVQVYEKIFALRRVMAETWMQSPDFDGLRDTPGFRAIPAVKACRLRRYNETPGGTGHQPGSSGCVLF